MNTARRRFLVATGIAGTTGLCGVLKGSTAAEPSKPDEKGKPGEEVSAPEDLMREHGVLRRILLIYEEGLRRIERKGAISPEVFHRAASLVRRFVEDYHEKLEEKFVFPVFEKRQQHVELVHVLLKQHEAGRTYTATVLACATPERFQEPADRGRLASACRKFIRMYRPHSAREDTVLFPAFRKLLSAREMDELGDRFEAEEDRLFGDEGFEKTVDQVAAIEKELGIFDLAQFT